MTTLTPTYPIIRPDRTKEFAWYLDEDVEVSLSWGDKLTIKKGYRFDGHSVPRILWTFFPPFGLDIYAALVHDFIYEYNKSLSIVRSAS